MTLSRKSTAVVLTVVMLLMLAFIIGSEGGIDEQLVRGESGTREGAPAGQARQGGVPAGSTVLPTSVALLLGLAGPAVAMVAIVASNRRESRRLEQEERREIRRLDHDEESLRAELEERKQADLRTARREAYRIMGKITTTVDPANPFAFTDLAEAHFEIQMLTNSSRVLAASEELFRAAFDARKVARDAWLAGTRPAEQDPEVRTAFERSQELRERFMDTAREELGLPPRPERTRYPLELRQLMQPLEAEGEEHGTERGEPPK